ncbi:helix-turn-helix domain-containing protein [Kribbella monticola]|uniref:helix-turn-helix domain-containing protein n=1 Tax=Kribbella monticola TaxID=2185285 RepID=UPI000DD45286
MSIDESCAYLRISRWSFYRLIHTKQLMTVKIGRRRFATIDDLDALIARMRSSGVA